ncbi:hypothetical protein HLB44_15975 [Aquincola sp. S2]|uniref:Uncharacterized protein n=1 Tax=Pseudaquabacterium terrae TaxID=2732868 RepID=A0ABX2EIP0_9BURK|nr:hypothetical protein [Aquabacterium terrae]NRF68493.1 hypothetical protein [Aquabacterium terrae]
MQTFMARFVRPNGERGVIYVVAASAAVAMLDVMRKQGPVNDLEVEPRRLAALLVPPLAAQQRPGHGTQG